MEKIHKNDSTVNVFGDCISVGLNKKEKNVIKSDVQLERCTPCIYTSHLNAATKQSSAIKWPVDG